MNMNCLKKGTMIFVTSTLVVFFFVSCEKGRLSRKSCFSTCADESEYLNDIATWIIKVKAEIDRQSGRKKNLQEISRRIKKKQTKFEKCFPQLAIDYSGPCEVQYSVVSSLLERTESFIYDKMAAMNESTPEKKGLYTGKTMIDIKEDILEEEMRNARISCQCENKR